MNNTAIPSDTFKQSYCIFIGSDVAKEFAQKVKEFSSEAIKVLQANFNPNLSAVVIPNDQPFKSIESTLYKWRKEVGFGSGGFWGQIGMGYKDKTWSVVEA